MAITISGSGIVEANIADGASKDIKFQANGSTAVITTDLPNIKK